MENKIETIDHTGKFSNEKLLAEAKLILENGIHNLITRFQNVYDKDVIGIKLQQFTNADDRVTNTKVVVQIQ